MSLRRLMERGVRVEILRDVMDAQDEYGNPEASREIRNEYGGWVGDDEPRETTAGDVDYQRVERTLRLPVDAVVTGRDRVRIDGVTYEILGPPSVARTPRGPHHLKLRIRRTET